MFWQKNYVPISLLLFTASFKKNVISYLEIQNTSYQNVSILYKHGIGIIDNNFDIEQSPNEAVSRDNMHFSLCTSNPPRLLIIFLLYRTHVTGKQLGTLSF